VVDVVEDAKVLFSKTLAIFVRIFLKSPSEFRIKFFSFDNSSFSGGFVLPSYLSVLEVVVLVVVEVLIVDVFVGFSSVDEGMSLFVLLLLLFWLGACGLLQILSVILSISFRALVEPPFNGDLEQSSGSKFPLVLPGFLFPLSLFSVLEQSVLATLLRVSQSHFEAPSGPFLEGSKAGPTHLRSQAVVLTGTMVGFPVEKVSVPYSMKESQSNGVPKLLHLGHFS